MKLEDFYGKKVYSVKTKLTRMDKGIEVSAQLVSVYQPKPKGQFQPVVPSTGCHIIIHGSSCKSENIYEIGGVKPEKAYDYGDEIHITSYGYCLPENLEALKKEQLKVVLAGIKRYIKEKQLMLTKLKKLI
ncbi:hypothetical protein [Tenacibaculum sp.]|uniref:hypothetical protein n=1 Tax=Tenacibaculum sp. TaxID=1906242 RepID=UPI003D0BB739